MNIKKIIKEEMGVNEDVKSIAEFLHNHFQKDMPTLEDLLRQVRSREISTDEYMQKRVEMSRGDNIKAGTSVFNSEQLPTLKDLKINSLIVTYNPNRTRGGAAAFFDAGKSYMTENGIVAYLTFVQAPDIATIYHELTHVLQYFKIGGPKMAKSLKPMKSTQISAGYVKHRLNSDEEREVIKRFTYYIYQSSEDEISAKVTETYAHLKKHMDDFGKTHVTTIENQSPYMWSLSTSHGWQVAQGMINYDVFEQFKKLNPDTTIKFFSYIKNYNSFLKLHDKGWKRFFEVVKMIAKLIYHTKTDNVKLISEDEVIGLMNQYGKLINNQGRKLKKKLIKLHGHFA